MAFQDFEPIFAEPKLEWKPHTSSSSLRPFLFHAYAPHSSHLIIHVTDFHSDTWEANLSVSLLEDIRDIIGIGGSWSEFADYFVNSLKSEDLKLVLETDSNSDGVSSAKLIAQKSKGMPLITIPLTKLVDSGASEAVSNLSLSLFKAFKSIKCSLGDVHERSLQLTNVMTAEKERNETIQLDRRQKFQKISDSEKAGGSNNGVQNSPDKQTARDKGTAKVKNRAMPAYRRAKVRGALLRDSDPES
ncbi:U2 small nuclear ribonucleoprotein auxiliary factor protein [Trifolium repens]|nr:U2 small nuclear ribonucleoprotein auxiliary factor protein [Trifolium repens]